LDKLELKNIVEALLIATPEPLTEARFQQSISEDTEVDIPLKDIIELLQEEYADSGRAFQVFEVAGGYQLVTRPEYESYVRKLFARSTKLRLSQAALETLAIVAYRQPVTRVEVDAIRGVNSDSPLRTLLERKLLEIRGRDDGPGRALLYKTSTEFLQYFGLQSIKDLPQLKEVDQLIPEEDQNLV